jgi:hypothetical protein
MSKKKTKGSCPIKCPADAVCVRSYLRDTPISAAEYKRLVKKYV